MAITISPNVLLTIICQAVEVYRQEAYGYLLISNKDKDQQVAGAISYQTAKRNGFYEIEDTIRTERVFKWASEITTVYDGWHSHTYTSRQKLCAKPTIDDIKHMTIGHFEIIVALQKTKRKYTKDWFEKDFGLSSSINGYMFLLRCWKKITNNEVKELRLMKIK